MWAEGSLISVKSLQTAGIPTMDKILISLMDSGREKGRSRIEKHKVSERRGS